MFFRCLFDRSHSKLKSLARLPDSEKYCRSEVSYSQKKKTLLSRSFLTPFPSFLRFSFIAELTERSPIITQNSSNPSCRKNLDVRPYDRTTVRPYKVLLLTCVVNCTAGTPTPRLCPVVQWSVHWAPSRTTRVLVLAGARRCALETCGKKKMRAPLLGLAKSIC